jgi:hypothetical protein
VFVIYQYTVILRYENRFYKASVKYCSYLCCHDNNFPAYIPFTHSSPIWMSDRSFIVIRFLIFHVLRRCAYTYVVLLNIGSSKRSVIFVFLRFSRDNSWHLKRVTFCMKNVFVSSSDLLVQLYNWAISIHSSRWAFENILRCL